MMDHQTLDISAQTLAYLKSTGRVVDLNREVRDQYVANGRPLRAESRCQRSCIFNDRFAWTQQAIPPARPPGLRAKFHPVDLDDCGGSVCLHARKAHAFRLFKAAEAQLNFQFWNSI